MKNRFNQVRPQPPFLFLQLSVFDVRIDHAVNRNHDYGNQGKVYRILAEQNPHNSHHPRRLEELPAHCVGLLPHHVAAHGPWGPDAYKPVPLRVLHQDPAIVYEYPYSRHDEIHYVEPGSGLPQHSKNVYVQHERHYKQHEPLVMLPELLYVGFHRVYARNGDAKEENRCCDKRQQEKTRELRHISVDLPGCIPVGGYPVGHVWICACCKNKRQDNDAQGGQFSLSHEHNNITRLKSLYAESNLVLAQPALVDVLV